MEKHYSASFPHGKVTYITLLPPYPKYPKYDCLCVSFCSVESPSMVRYPLSSGTPVSQLPVVELFQQDLVLKPMGPSRPLGDSPRLQKASHLSVISNHSIHNPISTFPHHSSPLQNKLCSYCEPLITFTLHESPFITIIVTIRCYSSST